MLQWQRPGPLGWAVFLSVAVHVALLGGWYRPTAGAMDERGVLRMRMVSVLSETAVMDSRESAVATSDQAAPAPESPPNADTSPVVPVEAKVVPAAETPSKPNSAVNYRTTQQGLDPPPRFLQEIEPEYPAAALLQEGSVVLRFLISASGEVDEITVLRSTPPGVFDATALRAFAKARFAPGYFLGIPVASQKTIEVFFMPTNRGGAVSGTAPIVPR